MVTRRDVIVGAAAFSGSAAASFSLVGRPAKAKTIIAEPIATGVKKLELDLAERPAVLPCFDGKTLPLWTFQEGTTFPIVRMKLGQRFEAHFKNDLPRPGEYATIHWHGLRIPNDQDGVPFLTQQPVEPGAEGHYAFTPPDTGSYFFHTHCNTVEHFGRGLIGILIIEGDEVSRPDAEHVILMKDWRVSPDGKFLPFMTDEGAARGGTAGTIRSVNCEKKAVIKVPSSADVRVRFYNIDSMRISEIGFEGGEAAIIAVDGNGLPPVPLESWRMGPAMRLDMMLRTAPQGGTVRLVDYFAKEPVVLAEFVSEGAPKRSGAFAPAALKVTPFEACNVADAQRIPFEFSATATGVAVSAAGNSSGIEIGSLCLSRRNFWAINKEVWPGPDHRELGPPLATLQSGQSYIFELVNRTPQSHPIHIHGHTFQFLSSNLRKLPAFRCDTILLLPKERIEVGLVAGDPGKWMFHCHIIEHQEAGMMGYITVV
jgi:FtsP/CotA-like multicopper oxidase with cupredoxin domain